MHRILYIIILLSVLSCTAEQQSAEKQKSQGQSSALPADVSYILEIAPADASRNSTLHLMLSNANLSDAKIEWLINGIPVASDIPYRFNASGTRKGDKIQALAIISSKEVLSNVVEIKNAPPEISSAKIMPETFKPGDTLSIDVTGSDADGDPVTIFYEWIKNGEQSGNKPQIDGTVKRDDRVDIKITPYDGEAYGNSIILHREIKNLPPAIIENKEFHFDGDIYTFQANATDPDKDNLTYSLKRAPDNMTIDKSTGLIKWKVPEDFIGKAFVTVSVYDGHGGEAIQDLTVEIIPEK